MHTPSWATASDSAPFSLGTRKAFSSSKILPAPPLPPSPSSLGVPSLPRTGSAVGFPLSSWPLPPLGVERKRSEFGGTVLRAESTMESRAGLGTGASRRSEIKLEKRQCREVGNSQADFLPWRWPNSCPHTPVSSLKISKEREVLYLTSPALIPCVSSSDCFWCPRCQWESTKVGSHWRPQLIFT